MDKIPSTAALLDDLHRCIPVTRESSNHGQSEKARNVRQFSHQFRELPKLIAEEHSQPTAEETLKIETIITTARSQREMIYMLMRLTRDVLEPICNEFLGALEYGSLPQDRREQFENMKNLFVTRLQKIRPYITSNQKTERMKKLHILQQLILGGVVNVAHVSWSYFNEIPEIIARERRKGIEEVSSEECAEISTSVQAIIMNVVSCQDDVFHEVDRLMRRRPVTTDNNVKKKGNDDHVPPFYWHLYHSSDLRLEDRKLELTPDLIERAKHRLSKEFEEGKIQLDEPRVGCGGIVLIPAIHQWCLRAAKQCFFPRIQEIKKLPRVISEPPKEIVPAAMQEKSEKRLILPWIMKEQSM